MPLRLAAILFCLLLPGCVIIDVGVTNPIPGMSHVAVVPFRNLTEHPDSVVDGRRFAMTYASELQKVPGFEVVAVGVAELAMVESGLKFESPEDLLELARLLEVDVVVVGAVTDYDPYYPPRVGLQVEWLSPHPWMFSPGVQTDPSARERLIESVDNERKRLKVLKKAEKKSQSRWSRIRKRLHVPVTIRGQSLSPDIFDLPASPTASEFPPHPGNSASDSNDDPPETFRVPPMPPVPGNLQDSEKPSPMLSPPTLSPSIYSTNSTSTTEPLMAYSRFFDGSDADLVAELRDYVELNGDLRGGGWEAYLQRSDDFVRFICHRMIEEMLTLHGGEGRRRIILKLRKYK